MTTISNLPTQKPSAITAFRNVLGINNADNHSRALWYYLSVAEREDVASFTGALDLSTAHAECLEANTFQGPFVYPVVGRIAMPFGKMRMASSVTLDRSVHYIGHSRGQGGGNYGSMMVFDSGLTGFTVIKGNTGPDTNGGDATIFEGLLIQGSGTDITRHGVDIQARCKFRDSTVQGFGGNGANVLADIAQRKNANLWSSFESSFTSNGLSGIFTQGGDTNAGNVIGGNFSDNGAWGIWDNSFLGNTYSGCHADGNGRKACVSYDSNRYYCIDDLRGGSVTPGTDSTCWVLYGPGGFMAYYWPAYVPGATYFSGGAYKASGASAANVFTGCYSEQGSQPPSRMNYPCVVVGGLHEAGIVGTAQVITGNNLPTLESKPNSAGAQIGIGKGSAGDETALLALSDPGGFPYRLHYKTGSWFLDWANAGGSSVLDLYNRATTPENGFARDMSTDIGGIGFPRGYYIGTGAATRVMPGNTAPVSGTWKRSDRVENSTPSAGGWMGWVCVTAGSPGTWKGYGQIEA